MVLTGEENGDSEQCELEVSVKLKRYHNVDFESILFEFDCVPRVAGFLLSLTFAESKASRILWACDVRARMVSEILQAVEEAGIDAERVDRKRHTGVWTRVFPRETLALIIEADEVRAVRRAWVAKWFARGLRTWIVCDAEEVSTADGLERVLGPGLGGEDRAMESCAFFLFSYDRGIILLNWRKERSEVVALISRHANDHGLHPCFDLL